MIILTVKKRGFSLLELIIVLAVIAILSIIAFPAYQSHLITARRVDGQTALYHLAAAMEKYAVKHQGYEEASFENLNIPTASAQGYYHLKIIHANTTDFLIAAEPIQSTSQAKDKTCGILAINDKSEKGLLVGNQLVVNRACW